MTFISYAQNFEDIMLWRALKHVEKGFYIDVGAAWPDSHSVTKAFYDYGWSGINIEPNANLYQQISNKRLRDINLNLAVGSEVGDLTMCYVNDTGLSTNIESIAHEHIKNGFTVEYQVTKVTTLNKIYEEYVLPGAEIHFLKIDVEGMEEAVLQGNDWFKCRPWIILIDSTLPLSQVECHGVWESILYSSGYIFAYADGINRFYVSQEHQELLPLFKYPPNVFDNYILSVQRQAELKTQEVEARAIEQIQNLYASKSWRMTAPFRCIGEIIRKKYLKVQIKQFFNCNKSITSE